DEVHPHLAAHMRQHAMAVLELHAEHRIGERLDHGALHFNCVFLRHLPGLQVTSPHFVLGRVDPIRISGLASDAGAPAPRRPTARTAGASWCSSVGARIYVIRRVKTSGPSSVTAIVCSKCAARLPSLVTAVQPSSRMRTSYEPIVTIGSMATTMPGLSCGPWPGSPKFGICGSSCRFRPIPWPTNARTTPKPCASTCLCTAWEMSLRR